jgi:ABC-type multidrug transport system ATPase subunit
MELVIENLSKKYGSKTVLSDVNLRSGPGLLGLVGANGAGKTTLMRILSTLLKPTTGRALWNEHDVQKDGQAVRARLGYLPQEFGLYPDMSARQFLRYMAAMKALPNDLARRRVDELIELVNLGQDADRKLGTYSGGMKQRVGIGQALLNDPELLIVDEPTAGLDPEERIRFRTLLANLTADRLVILSTHIMGDVEAVATRLVLLRQGRIVADASPEQLLAQAKGQVWSVTVDATTAGELQRRYKVSGLVQSASGIILRVVSPASPHPQAIPVEPTLEDVYLVQMGQSPEGLMVPARQEVELKV